MRTESGVLGTPRQTMAAGRRISRFFLLGSPSGREGPEREPGDGEISGGRDSDSPAASRPKGGTGRRVLRGEKPLWLLAPRALPPRSSGRSASLRRPQPAAKSAGAQGPGWTRADPPPRGARTSGLSRAPAAPRPRSHRRPGPLLPRGSPSLLPGNGRAISPPGPRLALGLAAYLSSSPRRTPGRLRPCGDIRAPGSGSGPHLQARAATGEAPRPATGGGSAEPRSCPGSLLPLLSVRSPA